MPKLVKVFLFVVFPLFLVLGGAYGLAKVGVIPIRQVAAKNHALGLALHLIGLDTPQLPAVQVTPASTVAHDPLDSQRRALTEQRSALDKERADWDIQRQAQVKTAAVKTVTEQAVADPKSIARLAAIYEQMPAETGPRSDRAAAQDGREESQSDSGYRPAGPRGPHDPQPLETCRDRGAPGWHRVGGRLTPIVTKPGLAEGSRLRREFLSRFTYVKFC
jgi:hypothetical protein